MGVHCNLHCVVMVVVVVCIYAARACVFSIPTSPFTDMSQHIILCVCVCVCVCVHARACVCVVLVLSCA